MAEARTFYDRDYYKGLTWWSIRDEIGLGLRDHYQVPKDLPPKLLALVTKLDDRDWLLPNASPQNDVDLFGG
jgi:hypothetical protein